MSRVERPTMDGASVDGSERGRQRVTKATTHITRRDSGRDCGAAVGVGWGTACGAVGQRGAQPAAQGRHLPRPRLRGDQRPRSPASHWPRAAGPVRR